MAGTGRMLGRLGTSVHKWDNNQKPNPGTRKRMGLYKRIDKNIGVDGSQKRRGSVELQAAVGRAMNVAETRVAHPNAPFIADLRKPMVACGRMRKQNQTRHGTFAEAKMLREAEVPFAGVTEDGGVVLFAGELFEVGIHQLHCHGVCNPNKAPFW